MRSWCGTIPRCFLSCSIIGAFITIFFPHRYLIDRKILQSFKFTSTYDCDTNIKNIKLLESNINEYQ